MFFCAFFFYSFGPHRYLHSFPTRRSSDLATACVAENGALFLRDHLHAGRDRRAMGRADRVPRAGRSEEHTSELQSRVDLVCRLLLEKKKKKKNKINKTRTEHTI